MCSLGRPFIFKGFLPVGCYPWEDLPTAVGRHAALLLSSQLSQDLPVTEGARMQFAIPFEPTTLGETKPGDLIHVAHPDEPFGWVLPGDDNQRLVGVLRDKNLFGPHYRALAADLACFRYPSGWVLDLPRQHARFAPGIAYRGTGQVTLGFDGPTITFGPLEMSQRERCVNLETFEWAQVDPNGAAFQSWHIWASAAEQHQSEATPVFSFAAP